MPLNEASPLRKGHLASALSSLFDAASLAALPTLVGLYLTVPGFPGGVPALLALYPVLIPLILPRLVVVLCTDNTQNLFSRPTGPLVPKSEVVGPNPGPGSVW